MRRSLVLGIFVLMSCAIQVTRAAEPDQTQAEKVLRSLNWVEGPAVVDVGSNAKFAVPLDFVFLHPADTKRIMELMENPSSGNESYFGPKDMRWFALFEYDDIGHVEDNEEIDAPALLKSIRLGTEAGNKERAKRGWAPMAVIGWKYPPFYDPQSKRLEWAIDGKSGNERVVNYNTRILARTGVTSAVLVADPSILDSAVAEFKSAVAGYEFVAGQRYAEYQPGDRMAEVGLAALIAGGAAAVASKKGFWSAIVAFLAAAWKFIAVAVVGVFAWAGSLFRKKQ